MRAASAGRTLIGLLGLAALGAPALGHGGEEACASATCRQALAFAEPAAFDEKTGANPDHLPAEARVDLQFIRLEVDLTALRERRASVVQTLLLENPRGTLPALEFDAKGLEIESVERLGEEAFGLLNSPDAPPANPVEGLEFSAGRERLAIALRTPLAEKGRLALRIRYQLRRPEAGMTFIEPLPGDPDQRWEVWTQGQPDASRHWFVCHDYPNDRYRSETLVRVPAGFQASAAGRLVRQTDNPDNTTLWHWRLDQDHVAYLTSLVVGQFHIERQTVDDVLLEYYVPPQNAADVPRTFGRTQAIMQFFASYFDEPFPWPRYAQLVVREFPLGGMENVTATTLTASVLQGEAADRHARACGENMEFLIVHELAHSWFGDLVTCRSWPHAWVNEGWATFCESLWLEHACGRDAYEADVWRNAQPLAEADRTDSRSPLVFHRLPNPQAAFYFNGSAIYNKGGVVLHLLRQELGEAHFQAGARLFLDSHRFGTATTEDLRVAFESVSRRDLEPFFRQWTGTPGTPALRVAYRFDAEARAAVVDVEQTQPITAEVPAFRFPLDLSFRLLDGSEVRRTEAVSERRHSFRVPVAAPPVGFAPDPDFKVLRGLTLAVPVALLAETARTGPTTFARLDAVRALGAEGSPAALEALRTTAADPRRPVAVRREALAQLARSGQRQEVLPGVLALARESAAPGGALEDFRVRAGVAEALGGFRDDSATSALLTLLRDPSEPVAVAAARALAAAADRPEVNPALFAAFQRRGEHDRLADAALDSLVRRGAPQAVEAGMEATRPGFSFRLRPRAAEALGRALEGRTLPPEGTPATARLLELLDEESRPRVQAAAARALGRARFQPARTRLELLERHRTDEGVSTAARDALADLRNATAAREEIKRLEDRLAAFEERLKKAEEDAPGPRGSQPPEAPSKPGKRRRFLGLF